MGNRPGEIHSGPLMQQELIILSRSTLSANLVVVRELVYRVGCSMMMEASAALWEDNADEPSTHVLTPPKLGALREVACDNILP